TAFAEAASSIPSSWTTTCWQPSGNRLLAGAVGLQPRPEPGEDVAKQLQGGAPVVSSLGDVADGDVQAALPGPVEEALDLGVDVELVGAAVADVHLELAGADVVGVEHLDGVLAADLAECLRIAAAVEGVEHLLEADRDDPIEAADDFMAVEIGAPA